MADWLDLAHEVVVVDSESRDLTPKLLREGLRHPSVRFLEHPPGLYASWNAGVRALTTEYVYISTVGETITRAGLEQLLRAAEQFAADVVLSKPEFKTPGGESVATRWPIDDIRESLNITSPRRLQRLEAIVFACVHAASALTGSCASDLFRTDCLKRWLFPTDFGTAGDGVWSVRHAAQVRWVVVPGCFSTFLLHSTAASQSENPAPSGVPRADAVLRQAVATWRQESLVTEADLAQLHWGELHSALTAYLDEKSAFDRARKSRLPWILNPRAWQARARRQEQLTRLKRMKHAALGAVAAQEAVSHPERWAVT
jgi:hypothetical protein